MNMSDTSAYAEKRKALRTRERLIEILTSFYGVDPMYYGVEAQALADHLIANGVTVIIKKEKPPTDLSKKCGSCAYAKAEPDEFGRDCYVRCTNPEHIAKYCRSRDRSLRQRTTPACKQYKAKEEIDNG